MRTLIPALMLAVCALAGCSTQPPQVDHTGSLIAQRGEKDAMLREAADSPVPKADLDRFVPLAYYPIDEHYAVPASLEPLAERTRIQVPTSTGKIRNIERVGTLKFSLQGKPMRLTAFIDVESPQQNRLFVPFADQTSGTETYPAGRYMELDPTATGIYVVDFNIAYNPYCYYSPEFDCPYPPKENRLDAAIRAGERVHHANAGAASDRF